MGSLGKESRCVEEEEKEAGSFELEEEWMQEREEIEENEDVYGRDR